MKQIFLKAWLILACLLVGVGESVAEEVQIYLNEGATGTTNGITATGNVNTNANNGNPGNSFANTSSSNTTFTFSGFDVSAYSDLKLVLDAKWSSFPATTNTFPSLTVKAYKNDVEVFSDATTIAVSSKVTTYNEYTINITSDFDKIVLTSNPSVGKTAKGAASTLYSLYMDNIKVVGTATTGGDPEKTTPTLSFSAPTYNATVGETFTAPELTNPDGVAVTYASSQTSVATVNATSGEVALVAPGETKITASFAGDATRNPASASYNLIVAENIADKTIAEFIASEGGKCYLTGVVSNIKNTTYGNFDLTDESGTIYVYGCLDADKQKGNFSTLDVVEGDKIKVLAESYEYYQNTTHEATNVIFVEEIPYEKPKYTVTIEDAMNGTLTVKEGANVLTSGDEVELGKTLTIECSPYDGYRYESWYYKEDGDWVTMTDVMTHVVTKDITITASFGEIPAYTVAWSVNGEVVDSKVYAEGATVTAPENPSDINGKVFTGWVASGIDGVVNDVPAYVTPTTATADVTYYAVFATYNSDARPDQWQTTALSDLTSSDVFVMASGTNAISSANGTSGSPSAVSLIVSEGKITSEVTDDIKWNLAGNATDGYTFYANGTANYLYVNTTATSGSNTCIRVGKQNSNVRNNWMPNDKGYLKTNDTYTVRYLSYYAAASDFRGYVNTSNGAFAPTFYKFIPGEPTYSDYCTILTIPVTFKEAGLGYSTLYSDKALEIPEGVEAYALTKNETAGYLTPTQIEEVIPANTGVMLVTENSGWEEGAKTYHFAYTTTENTVSTDLLGVTEETDASGNEYVLSVVEGQVGFYKFEGAKLAANKAYYVSDSAVRGFYVDFTGEQTTGIYKNENENENGNRVAFDLTGRRINASAKGISIMAGKKVIR